MRNFLFIHLALAALALAACGSRGSANASISTLASVPSDFAGQTNPLGMDAAAAGALVFKTNCEACHGPEGHGDGPAGAALDPAPKNLVELQIKAGDDYLYWRISTGKEGTAMVAWKGVLTDEQIWQVIAFLRTLK
jgi:high-affinity iron transporter